MSPSLKTPQKQARLVRFFALPKCFHMPKITHFELQDKLNINNIFFKYKNRYVFCVKKLEKNMKNPIAQSRLVRFKVYQQGVIRNGRV